MQSFLDLALADRVVGFNIDSGDASDHVIALQLDKSAGVDIWGLADVWDDGVWLERLQRGAASGEGSEFGLVLGATGGQSRLLAIYRQSRLEYLGHEEIAAAQSGRRGAAPLAVRFRLDGDTEFVFLVVNLSESKRTRAGQVEALAAWSAGQSLPVVAVGTFNFGVASDGDKGELERLGAAGWQWVVPEDPVGTSCHGGSRVHDFVFLAGPATGWAARSDVMFPQKNYCPDDGRTSDHRPILANLETAGGDALVTGVMPEREIRPFFPDTLVTGSDAQIRLATDPEPVPASTDVATSPIAPAAGEPTRAELLRRLERLEAEVQSLRQAIEAQSE